MGIDIGKDTRPPSPPKTIIMGRVEVGGSEKDLLSSQERSMYQGGFERLKVVTSNPDSLLTLGFLTSPDVSSNIIGIQPIKSYNTWEAALMAKSFSNAGKDINENYTLLKGSEGLVHILNIESAETVFKNNQEVLGLNLGEEKLTKEQLTFLVKELFNGEDRTKATLAHGLLSGFPLGDCEAFCERGEGKVSKIVGEFKDTGKYLPEKILFFMNNVLEARNILKHYFNRGVDEAYLPNKLGKEGPFIEGFGLSWRYQDPISEETMEHCQKLLQIDKELGIIDLARDIRNKYGVATSSIKHESDQDGDK